MKTYVRLLSIAGSDSGGGAGIQADLKTFAACGGYGMSAITALTAQNTLGVTAIQPVPVAFLEAQLRAVLEDIGVDAIKIGMLHSSAVIACVAAILEEYRCPRVVLDPVMVATSGDRLIQNDAIAAMKEQLFPRVGLITPNVPEAALLLGRTITSEQELRLACRDLVAAHHTAVLLKAGHLSGETVADVLLTGPGISERVYVNPRLDSCNTHGTGCTLSSAVAAFWGRGLALADAVGKAVNYLHGAIAEGAQYRLGGGHGPVHHFYNLWR